MLNYEILTQTILPLSLHGINPRNIMGASSWNKIKKAKQKEADHQCMCCDEYVAHVPGDWLECHEVYDIDMDKREFKLKDLVCLCKRCHDYIHQGRLRILLIEEKISQQYYDEIVERGDELLQNIGLKKMIFQQMKLTIQIGIFYMRVKNILI